MEIIKHIKIRHIFLTGIAFLVSISTHAYGLGEKLNAVTCGINCSETSCSELAKAENPSLARIVVLAVIVFMLALFFSRKYKNKFYLAGGSILSMALVSLVFINPFVPQASSQNCAIVVVPSVGIVKDTATKEDFKSPDGDFEPLDNARQLTNSANSETKPINTSKSTENTINSATEFTSVGDEFSTSAREFSQTDSLSGSKIVQKTTSVKAETKETDYQLLYQLGVLFALLILISYLIKYEIFRKTKGLFLMASVAYLGFYKGACPCMILSFQNTLLAMFGQSIEWVSMVWFLGLLPLTYFFGKIWCGWLCHLGGFQDFIYQSPKLEILKSVKAQKILRNIRTGFLAVLIIQLLITKTNIYIHYDPFKVAFNLFSANHTGYVLLVLLLVTSVLIYRPFCRAVCPVGLILGWISLIPGARHLSKNESCVDCVSCAKPCRTKAMIYEDKKSILNVQDCVLCGDCMGSCKKNSLKMVNFRK